MESSNKERKEHKKHKKSKKHKEHKEHKDKKRKHEDDMDLNAGSFKKALVTPTTETVLTPAIPSSGNSNSDNNATVTATAVPPTSSRPVATAVGAGSLGGLDELALFTGGHSSADDDSSSDEDVSISRSKALQKVRSETAATMAAVADLLTSTNAGSGSGGVSADVIKMQQQLQQQIPFTAPASSSTSASSNNNVELTREDILKSIAGISDMQMLLQQDSLATAAAAAAAAATEQQQHAQDANAILMSLSNDPSILATVNNTEHQPTLGQLMQQEAAVQAAAEAAARAATGGIAIAETKASSSKKKKPTVPKVPKQTRTGLPASKAPPLRALEEQMDYDMAGTSDSLLHTKWMMATELKERGIKYRMGTFSAEEDNIIRQSISEYISRHNMPEHSIHEWFEKSSGRGSGKLERNELKPLWVEIAGRLKTRPLLNIYLHVRRMYHPQNNIGAWTKADDAKLVEMYAKHKGQWTVIGQALGRMADSCRDRYRNHLKDQATMNSGTWAPEEDRKLLDIMQELALKQGKTNLADATHMWTAISEKMGGTRSRHQCRHRYTQSLQPKMEMADWKPPTLAETMAASNVIQLRKSISAKNQQASTGEGEEGSSTNVLQASTASTVMTDPGEQIRALAAALQGAIPAGSDGNLLWTQAIGALLSPAMLTAPVAAESTTSSGSSGIATAAAHVDLEANPNPLPPAPDHLQRRTGARQRALDVLRLIEKTGYKEINEIKWKTMAKKLRSKIQEANGEVLGKIIEARERLATKKDKAVADGDRYNGSVLTGVVAAMDVALAAAHAESVTTVQFSASSAVLQHGFGLTRTKVEGYKAMPFKELLEKMIKLEEEEVGLYRVPGSTWTSPEYSEAATVPGPAANRETFISVSRFRQMRTFTVAKLAATKALSSHFGENSRRVLSSIQSRAEDILKDEFSSPDMVPILYQLLQKMRPQTAAMEAAASSTAAANDHIRTNEFVESGDDDSDYEGDAAVNAAVAAAAAAAAAAGKSSDDQQQGDISGEDDE
ncbi:RNA polymerase I enhancer binding protein [Linnemannia exigua]|uniref:RNA polymerase I enhancer binding protein n=1 Tax=Linnemannia exigua TaxID=604196 RepID=A0AAD4DFD6_9FUNG|nr:RNA polymerase I enhancer binding protein [Linnemannia exigua]